jgi:DNA-directed RNA polymerase specialized sigma subunit
MNEAKEFLKQYERAVDRASRYEAEYKLATEQIDAIGSTLSGDGQPHGTGISRKTEDKAVRLTEIREKWKQAKDQAFEVRQRVLEVIIDIPDIEGKVLYERYINLLTWEQIAEKLYYSNSGIFYAHGRALDIVKQRLSKDE